MTSRGGTDVSDLLLRLKGKKRYAKAAADTTRHIKDIPPQTL